MTDDKSLFLCNLCVYKISLCLTLPKHLDIELSIKSHAQNSLEIQCVGLDLSRWELETSVFIH